MKSVYNKISSDIKDKFQSVRLLVLDFDGVLTNNKVYVTQQGIETVQADRSDGLGLEYLRKYANIDLLILSKETNPVTLARAKKLNIPCIASLDSKIQTFHHEINKRMLKTDEVCYIGNDINDIDCMRQAGVCVAVADSYEQVLGIADYITTKNGGNGAVREICELIMYCQGVHPIIESTISSNNIITSVINENIRIKQKMLEQNVEQINQIVDLITDTYKNKGKILLLGNGGSAADCQHIAGEFVGRFKMERKALPALALHTNSSIMTALANDYSYEMIFSRQVEANACNEDVVWGISTSGNSENILQGLKKAKELGLKTVGFTGSEGSKMKELCDVCFVAPSSDTPRIQEAHITVAHIICEIVEKNLFLN